MANTKLIAINKSSNSGGTGGYITSCAASAMTCSFKKLYSNYAAIDEIVSTTAKINEIKSNNISTTILDAAKGNVKNLYSEIVEAENISSIVDNTEELNAVNANIGHANIQNAGINDLHNQKANIDFAKIRELIATDITTDNLNVLKSAHFFELIIDQIKACGGALILSPADGFELFGYEKFESSGYTYLYWLCENEGKGRYNMWKAGDQALCQNFNNAQVGTNYNISNKYWWARVYSTSGENPVWCHAQEDGTVKTIDNYDYIHPTLKQSDFTKIDGYMYVNTSTNTILSYDEYNALTESEQNNYSRMQNVYYVDNNGTFIYITEEQYNGNIVFDNYYIGEYCKADYKRCHWIRISHSQCDPNSTFDFEVGDNIVMLGSQTDTTRQSAIYISAYNSLDSGLTAPLIAQYRGINDFNLSSHRKSYFDAKSAEFYGTFKIQSDNSSIDGTNVLDHMASSPLMVIADNYNVNIPCNSLGEPIDNTAYYGTYLHINYGASEQNITYYEITSYLTSDCYPSLTYVNSSTVKLEISPATIKTMDMVESIEVELTCQYGTKTTTVNFNKIIPGQNGTLPELYELVCTPIVQKKDKTNGNSFSIGVNKFENGKWKSLSSLDSSNIRIIYLNDNSSTWLNFASSSTELPKTRNVTASSTIGAITYRLVQKTGDSWSVANYANETVLDTQTVALVSDGKDGDPGKDGTGTSGEFDQVLWNNKEFMVDAAGNLTVNLQGQLQHIIGSVVQSTYDWTNYRMELSIPEFHASWGEVIYFDNTTTTSTGKFHTGETGDFDVCSPFTLVTDFFNKYNASTQPDRILLKIYNGSNIRITESIPLIFKAGAIFSVVDDAIDAAVLDDNGSIGSIRVTAEEAKLAAQNAEEQAAAVSVQADNIDLSIREGLERTGINIANGTIDIDADCTNFHGSIKMFDSDDGLIIFNDNNEQAVTIQKSNIGEFGASQNTTTLYKSAVGTYTYIHVDGSNQFRSYINEYDTTASYLSETSWPISNGMKFDIGRNKVGNVLNFNNINYTITGDNNNAWTGNIANYKVMFKIEWLNSDHTVYDSGWIQPTRKSDGSFSIPNVSYTLNANDGGDGYSWCVLMYFKGPNTAIDGTQNKHIKIQGNFTLVKTVSTNTKIGVDGMYSLSNNGQLWAGEDRIGMYFKNTANTMYGANNTAFGISLDANGISQSIGANFANLVNFSRVESVLKVTASTKSNTNANRALGEIGWTSWSYDPVVAKVDWYGNGLKIHPSVIYITGTHPSYSSQKHFVFLNTMDSSYPSGYTPIGACVTIINHSGSNNIYASGYNASSPSMLPKCIYDDETTTLYQGFPVKNGRSIMFMHLGDGNWKPMLLSGGTESPTNF